MPKALVFDPDLEARQFVGRICRAEGYVVAEAITLAEAVHEVSKRMPEVIFVFVQSFDDELEAFLGRADVVESATVFLLCDQATIALAKVGMRVGAAELFTKPLARNSIRTAMHNLRPDIDVPAVRNIDGLVVASPELENIHQVMQAAVAAKANVLLHGESGVGKEALVKQIARPDEHIEIINQARLMTEEVSIPSTASHAVCYFFDAVHELDEEGLACLEQVLGLQASSEGLVRVVTATDDLNAIEAGALRQDLYYCIAQVTIYIPPLRERPQDLVALIQQMLLDLNTTHQTTKYFTDTATDILLAHDWPGNARELENAIFHAFILSDRELDTEHLPQSVLQPNQVQLNRTSIEISVGSSLAEAEQRLIEATMLEFDHDKKQVATVLGISLRTLYNKLGRYGTQLRGS